MNIPVTAGLVCLLACRHGIYKGFQKENITTVLGTIALCPKVHQWSLHDKQKCIGLDLFLCSEFGQLLSVLQKNLHYEFCSKDQEPLKVSKADVKMS